MIPCGYRRVCGERRETLLRTRESTPFFFLLILFCFLQAVQLRLSMMERRAVSFNRTSKMFAICVWASLAFMIEKTLALESGLKELQEANVAVSTSGPGPLLTERSPPRPKVYQKAMFAAVAFAALTVMFLVMRCFLVIRSGNSKFLGERRLASGSDGCEDGEGSEDGGGPKEGEVSFYYG